MRPSKIKLRETFSQLQFVQSHITLRGDVKPDCDGYFCADASREKDLPNQASPGPATTEALSTATEEEQEEKPEIKAEDGADDTARSGGEDATSSKGESCNDDEKIQTMLNSELEKQAECAGNGHRKREKQKQAVVNGLIISSSSPETVHECSAADNAVEPKPKKIKTEGDHEIPVKEIEEFLSDESAEKAPSEPQLTTASATSVAPFGGSVSARLKVESTEERKDSSESEHSSSEKLTNLSDSTDSGRARKEKAQITEEDRDDKKDSDSARKQKKKREKKKRRHHSGNDSTGSDVPGSPMTSHSSMPRPSPTRSRISFDADLGNALFCGVRWCLLHDISLLCSVE